MNLRLLLSDSGCILLNGDRGTLLLLRGDLCPLDLNLLWLLLYNGALLLRLLHQLYGGTSGPRSSCRLELYGALRLHLCLLLMLLLRDLRNDGPGLGLLLYLRLPSARLNGLDQLWLLTRSLYEG